MTTGGLRRGRSRGALSRNNCLPEALVACARALSASQNHGRQIQEKEMLKGIALWALGIPLPIILLLYIFHVV